MTDFPGPDASRHPVGGVLSVADIAMELAAPLCPPPSRWPDSYRPFLSDTPVRPANACFETGAPERHPEEARFAVAYAAGAWKTGAVAGRTVYRFHAGADRAYLWAEPNGDFSAIAVWPEAGGRGDMPQLLHPVDRVLGMGVLAHRRAFIVHACGWSYRGKSVLFPGVSGAGKTTLCRQLLAAGQGTILSDDRVVLREGADGFRAWGTPWPGDAKQARNESAPLAALAFIEKAPEHRLTPIRSAEALRRLLEAASVPWFDAGLRDRVLPLLERLVSGVPAFRLGFRPDPGVAEILLPLLEAAR